MIEFSFSCDGPLEMKITGDQKDFDPFFASLIGRACILQEARGTRNPDGTYKMAYSFKVYDEIPWYKQLQYDMERAEESEAP